MASCSILIRRLVDAPIAARVARLLVSIGACIIAPAFAQAPAQVPVAPAMTAPATTAPAATEVPLTTTAPVTSVPSLDAKPLAPRMVLLLPLRSPDFARAAEVIRAGVYAARDALAPQIELTVAETDDSAVEVQTAYRDAAKNSPAAIIGPLTRPSVQAIAGVLDVLTPTVALNAVDADAAPNIVMFALQIEAEARQVAQLAIDDLRARDAGRKPTVVVMLGDGPLHKRSAQAFVETFEARGGAVLATIPATDRGPALQARLARLDPALVFLAVDAASASGLRAYMREVPAYGTSQLNARSERALLQDLEGVHIVDMPWLVQRNAPAVQIFARSEEQQRYSSDLDRLYAMGIDAFRLALDLAANKSVIGFDGVTGALLLRSQRVERRALPAVFRDGEAVADGS